MPETMEIWASRVKNADPATHVGEVNRIFYYPDSGTLRISDGSTPGGLPINLIGNLANIAIANFVFDNTTITTSVPNADINIEPNGNGQLNITGAFHVHAGGNLEAEPNFNIGTAGNITILVTETDTVGALEIIGGNSTLAQPPQTPGAMVHITGEVNKYSAVLLDGIGNVPFFVSRRYNGTVDSPTSVSDGQAIGVFGSVPYADGWPALSTGFVQITAHGNQTSSNRGSNVEIWTTPLNSTTASKSAWFNGDTFYANNITTSGRVNIVDSTAGNIAVLTVTNNQDGDTRIPVLANVIAQFTGQDNKTPYIVYDGYGNVNSAVTGPEFTFRAARGNLAAPESVQANDALGKIGAAGWGTTGYGGVLASAIEFQAADTFTDVSRPGKIVFKAIPPNSTSPATVLMLAPTTAVFNDGMVMSNAWINLPGGTSSQSPLTFTASSTLNASPSPGSLNFDGTVFYGVPTDQERGIIPTQQTYALDAARNLTAGTTAAQSIFGVGVNLSANTRYYYEISVKVAKNGSGSNAPTLNYGLAATNGLTLYSHRYWATSSTQATDTGVSTASMMGNYITTGFATGVPVTAAMPVAVSYAQFVIRGYIDVNVAGTLTPQIAFSDAPNTSASIQPKSSMIIYPVGLAGENTSTGTWA